MEFDEKTGYSMDALQDMAYAKENRRVARRDFQLAFWAISLYWIYADGRFPHTEFVVIFLLIYAAAIFIGRLMTARY